MERTGLARWSIHQQDCWGVGGVLPITSTQILAFKASIQISWERLKSWVWNACSDPLWDGKMEGSLAFRVASSKDNKPWQWQKHLLGLVRVTAWRATGAVHCPFAPCHPTCHSHSWFHILQEQHISLKSIVVLKMSLLSQPEEAREEHLYIQWAEEAGSLGKL